MVVLVAANDVKRHTAELLVNPVHGHTKSPDGAQSLFVGMSTRLLEIEMLHSAERLHMDFLSRV